MLTIAVNMIIIIIHTYIAPHFVSFQRMSSRCVCKQQYSYSCEDD